MFEISLYGSGWRHVVLDVSGFGGWFGRTCCLWNLTDKKHPPQKMFAMLHISRMWLAWGWMGRTHLVDWFWKDTVTTRVRILFPSGRFFRALDGEAFVVGYKGFGSTWPAAVYLQSTRCHITNRITATGVERFVRLGEKITTRRRPWWCRQPPDLHERFILITHGPHLDSATLIRTEVAEGGTLDGAFRAWCDAHGYLHDIVLKDDCVIELDLD